MIVSGIRKSADNEALYGMNVQRTVKRQAVFRFEKDNPLTNAFRESHLYSGFMVLVIALQERNAE